MSIIYKLATLKLAGLLMVANALLHVVAPFVADYSEESMPFVIIGLIYTVVAVCFLKGIQWLAFIMVIIAPLGAYAAYSITGKSTVPDYLLWAIFIVDVCVTIVLISQIIRRKR